MGGGRHLAGFSESADLRSDAPSTAMRLRGSTVPEGDSFDMERTALQLQYPFDGLPPTATPRLWNLAAITKSRKRPLPNR